MKNLSPKNFSSHRLVLKSPQKEAFNKTAFFTHVFLLLKFYEGCYSSLFYISF